MRRTNMSVKIPDFYNPLSSAFFLYSLDVCGDKMNRAAVLHEYLAGSGLLQIYTRKEHTHKKTTNIIHISISFSHSLSSTTMV